MYANNNRHKNEILTRYFDTTSLTHKLSILNTVKVVYGEFHLYIYQMVATMEGLVYAVGGSQFESYVLYIIK